MYLNAISGLLKMTGGKITYEGRDITGHSPQAIVRGGLIQVVQAEGEFEIAPCLELNRLRERRRNGRLVDRLAGFGLAFAAVDGETDGRFSHGKPPGRAPRSAAR